VVDALVDVLDVHLQPDLALFPVPVEVDEVLLEVGAVLPAALVVQLPYLLPELPDILALGSYLSYYLLLLPYQYLLISLEIPRSSLGSKLSDAWFIAQVLLVADSRWLLGWWGDTGRNGFAAPAGAFFMADAWNSLIPNLFLVAGLFGLEDEVGPELTLTSLDVFARELVL
jgi:hypothetical protein